MNAAAAIACLQACQRAAPNNVIRLAGNHELLWLQERFKYAHATSDKPEARKRIVDEWIHDVESGAIQGAWSIGPVLFVHAGVRQSMVARMLAQEKKDEAQQKESEQLLASRLASVISRALRKGVARCSNVDRGQRRRCLAVADEAGIFSAGPERRGSGPGGPFWTDWRVLRASQPSWQQGQDWIWPPASVRLTATANGSAREALDASIASSFIQVVGHSAAKCNVYEADSCQPIRARRDMAAVVADAGISEFVQGNRALLQIEVVDNPTLGSSAHFFTITKDRDGKWNRLDLTASICAGTGLATEHEHASTDVIPLPGAL